MIFSRHIRWWLVLLAVAFSLAAPAEKISDIHPVNYVTDLAGVLTPVAAARLNAICGEVERKTGAQIAVVTVKSLEGRPIEDYSVDLFKQLGVGGKKDDRGILILLAPPERKYRFEVGYGLEPVINDARAGDIGREMVPYLRENNYDTAIGVAVVRVATRIAQASNVTLDAAPRSVRSQRQDDVGFPWWLLPLGIFVVPVVLRAIGGSANPRSRYRRGAGGWIGPGGFGGGFGGGGGWGGGGGFGGFGGGASGGGGAGGSW